MQIYDLIKTNMQTFCVNAKSWQFVWSVSIFGNILRGWIWASVPGTLRLKTVETMAENVEPTHILWRETTQ